MSKKVKYKLQRNYCLHNVNMHSRLCLNWNAAHWLSLILTRHKFNLHFRYTTFSECIEIQGTMQLISKYFQFNITEID